MAKRIEELEALFQACQWDRATLNDLRGELAHRTSRRAALLLGKVNHQIERTRTRPRACQGRSESDQELAKLLKQTLKIIRSRRNP